MTPYEKASIVVAVLGLFTSCVTLLVAFTALGTWKRQTEYSFETAIRTDALRNLMALESDAITALGREFRPGLPVAPDYQSLIASNTDVDRNFHWLYHSVYFSSSALQRWEKLNELHRFLPQDLRKAFHQSRSVLLSEISRVHRFSDQLLRKNSSIEMLDANDQSDRIKYLLDPDHLTRKKITDAVGELMEIVSHCGLSTTDEPHPDISPNRLDITKAS